MHPHIITYEVIVYIDSSRHGMYTYIDEELAALNASTALYYMMNASIPIYKHIKRA
jgi:hypothetical protein